MGPEFDLNVVTGSKVNIGIVTVRDRSSNRYCEDGSDHWNGYCDCFRNKRVVQHVKDPKTGDEYFELKLNESVGCDPWNRLL